MAFVSRLTGLLWGWMDEWKDGWIDNKSTDCLKSCSDRPTSFDSDLS